MITQVTQYQSERVLDVVFLWGERFEQWKDEAMKRLAAFGREHGCAAVEAISRRGLEKALAPLGWRKTRVVLRKEIV